MPLMQDIVLGDMGTGTSINRTFKPYNREIGGKAEWRTDHLAARSANHRFTIEMKSSSGAKGSSKDDKIIVSLYVPTMETLGTADNGFLPPATVKEVDWTRCELIFPRDATPARRETVLTYLGQLLNKADVVDAVKNGNHFRG